MSSGQASRRLAVAFAVALSVSGCAHSAAMRNAKETGDSGLDRAVVEYTKAVREDPSDRTAKLSLDRAKLRASNALRARTAARRQQPVRGGAARVSTRGRVEDQRRRGPRADGDAKRAARQGCGRQGRTDGARGADQPDARHAACRARPAGGRGKLADTLVFGEASARAVFTTIARFANLNLVFDPRATRRSRSTCAT